MNQAFGALHDRLNFDHVILWANWLHSKVQLDRVKARGALTWYFGGITYHTVCSIE